MQGLQQELPPPAPHPGPRQNVPAGAVALEEISSYPSDIAKKLEREL